MADNIKTKCVDDDMFNTIIQCNKNTFDINICTSFKPIIPE